MGEKIVYNTRGIPLHVINASINSCPPLERIHAGMQEESALLPTSIDSLRRSYDNGLGIALVTKEGDAVGFLRFSQLLGAREKEQLGLPVDFPDVLEIGSAYINPSHRGGLYARFRGVALEHILERMQKGEVLVLGTTKTAKVLHANRHALDLGLQFEELVHTDLDGIAALTCVCTGDFGSGRQFGSGCPRRVTHQQLENIHTIASEQGGKIPCTMYVSDGALARRIDVQIINIFGSYENWIQALGRNGHYE